MQHISIMSKFLWRFFAICIIVLPVVGFGQEYQITVKKAIPVIDGIHFKQGTHVNPDGDSITVNNLYIKYNDHAFFPIMGEFHYSRYPRGEWEDAILKMKASGIQMIAFYCFWNLHEEQEGEIRFDENRDVRAFIQLCAKHNLWAFPRIGPWCHGEARYGGYPDWFADKFGGKFGGWGSFASGQHYSTDYWHYYVSWYKALGEQFSGLYFKDGGPIIGIQFDNEVRSKGKGSPGYEYIKELKKLALNFGIDVPLYTVTGWTGSVAEDEVMPTWGGYPDAPWAGHIDPIISHGNYTYTLNRRDEKIGSDLFKAGIDFEVDTSLAYRHPYLTAELGGGNQITYHRRVKFVAADLLAIIYSRLGAGTNGNGYYIYHGTQHPLSADLDHPTQESKAAKYNLDYPMISYDFLSPITEWGFLRDYYHDYKLVHLFLEEFGSYLAPMNPVWPDNYKKGQYDASSLRYVIRNKGDKGFLFYNTYCRNFKLDKHDNVQFNINLPGEKINLPDESIDIQSGVYGVMPFNLDLQDVLLKYSTAHPFARIEDDGRMVFFFYEQEGIPAEYKFDASTIESIKCLNGIKKENDGFIRVNQLKAGGDCQISIISKMGKEIIVCTLSYQQARFAYKFNIEGQDALLWSNQQVIYNAPEKRLIFKAMGENALTFKSFPELKLAGKGFEKSASKDGLFSIYNIELPEWRSRDILFKDVSDMEKLTAYTKSLNETPRGPTYGHIFDPEKPFRIYELDIPGDILSAISNLLVEFHYAGNTAQVYSDNILIADDYYSGGPMPFGLARHQDKLSTSKIRFQITPMLPKYFIYFEPGTDVEITDNYNAELKEIKLTPEYEFRLSVE